jgi:tRNA threonylcarbamoyladenosine biosynthesis protein TsaB
LSPGDCDAVAVSIGPGSFTGLRVGVVFAKTFAYVTGCKLAAVDTFRAIAAACPDDVSNVVVVSDAQRRELFVGRYRKDKNVECGERSTKVRVPNFEFGQGCWKRLGDIEIQPLDVWCAERDPGDVVTGPGVDSDEQEIASVCRVLHPDFRHPTARQVARLGEQQLIAGLEADVWTLEPFYLRKSAAEEKRQAAATGTNS